MLYNENGNEAEEHMTPEEMQRLIDVMMRDEGQSWTEALETLAKVLDLHPYIVN